MVWATQKKKPHRECYKDKALIGMKRKAGTWPKGMRFGLCEKMTRREINLEAWRADLRDMVMWESSCQLGL